MATEKPPPRNHSLTSFIIALPRPLTVDRFFREFQNLNGITTRCSML